MSVLPPPREWKCKWSRHCKPIFCCFSPKAFGSWQCSQWSYRAAAVAHAHMGERQANSQEELEEEADLEADLVAEAVGVGSC